MLKLKNRNQKYSLKFHCEKCLFHRGVNGCKTINNSFILSQTGSYDDKVQTAICSITNNLITSTRHSKFALEFIENFEKMLPR